MKESRRTFVRHLTVAVGGLAAAGAAAAAKAALPGATWEMPVPAPDVPWRRRIFCQFDRERRGDLLGALHRCAEETGCDIVFGDRNSPDVYAIGGFVLVLDRGAVGDETWRDYVEMYAADGDATPCFIIDNRRDLPLPDWNYARQFDMADPGSVSTIVNAIRQMKLEMNRRLPDLFRETANGRAGSV